MPPADTRAHGRGQAVAFFQQHNVPYLINWDSVAFENHNYLMMPDPFETYAEDVARFVR